MYYSVLSQYGNLFQVFQKVREENDDVFDNLKSKISAHKQGLHVNKERNSSVKVEELLGKGQKNSVLSSQNVF